MKRNYWVILLVLMFLLATGCKDQSGNDSELGEQAQASDTEQVTEESVEDAIKVQFSYASRYAQKLNEFYVIAGEHASIPIGYNVIISAPGDENRKFKVVITPAAGADPIEGFYETSDETYDKDYNEHLIMVDDLRHVYTIYAPTLEANCKVYEMTASETVVYDGAATVPAIEARELELINLEVTDNTVSASVTHYKDMVYEWRMNKQNDLALPPQSGDMGWSSEGFNRDEDTEVAVTIYDEQGRFNNFLFIYPKQ